MNPFSFIADAVKGFAAYFGWAQKRQELTNSPEMQANAAAKTEKQLKDENAAAIANKDEDEIKRRLAQ